MTSTTVEDSKIESLHSLYNDLTFGTTRTRVMLTLMRMDAWRSWVRRGWDEDDLRLVLSSLLGAIRCGRRTASCLRFSRLVAWGGNEEFEEHLQQFRATRRVQKLDRGKAQVLRATGREVEQNQSRVKSVGEVIGAMASPGSVTAEDWKRLKENL